MSSRRKAVPPLRLTDKNFNKNILSNEIINELDSDASTSLNNITNNKNLTNIDISLDIKDLNQIELNKNETHNNELNINELKQTTANNTKNNFKRMFINETLISPNTSTFSSTNNDDSISNIKKSRNTLSTLPFFNEEV